MTNDHTILVACKEAIEYLPPMRSLLFSLCELGERVLFVTSYISKETRCELEARGIRVFEAQGEMVSPIHKRSVFGRVYSWAKFRNLFWKVLGEFDRPPKLWIATGDSALAVGQSILKYRYILCLYEFYDGNKRYLRLLTPYIHNAVHVVTPEKTRSAIYRVWYKLNYWPTELPNKPYDLPGLRRMPVEDPEQRALLSEVGDRKLILYQALRVHMDLSAVAEAIYTKLGSNYVLGVQGEIYDKEKFSRLISTYPNVMHFKFTISRAYLNVTSYAHIGVMLNEYSSLHNLFCATNKQFEYGAFGVPMICNELPVFSLDLEKFHAGESFVQGDSDSIARAIKTIDSHYSEYCIGARALFDAVKFSEIVKSVIERL